MSGAGLPKEWGAVPMSAAGLPKEWGEVPMMFRKVTVTVCMVPSLFGAWATKPFYYNSLSCTLTKRPWEHGSPRPEGGNVPECAGLSSL